MAGGDTLIGGAICAALRVRGEWTSVNEGEGEPELTDADQVDDFFAQRRPQVVIHAAGSHAGIGGNRRIPADLMLDNLLCGAHVVAAAQRHGVERLLYLASSCVYPRLCPQPMRPEHVMTGPLEPTNDAYGTARLAILKLCQAFRDQYGARFAVGIPATPFGPGDDLSPDGSHVMAALLRRFHEARRDGRSEVVIWGSGRPRREFIYAPDLADACLFALDHHDGREPVNLGTGEDLTIAELAEAIRRITGFEGEIRFDADRPDGMPLKLMDSGPLRGLGWRPATPFDEALEVTSRWVRSRVDRGGE